MADGAATQPTQVKMTIPKGWVFYFSGLVAFLFIVWLLGFIIPNNLGTQAIIALVLYLSVGFVMNRVVLRGLIEWHPAYNTIENVSKGKLGLLLGWPVAYPVLFFKLLVVKHL